MPRLSESAAIAPQAVVALGGNALLRRGEPLEEREEARAAHEAAQLLAQAAATHRLIVTHGNGPQVGLLALMGEAYGVVAPYPLDVLDAETEGQVGYLLELELDNALRHSGRAGATDAAGGTLHAVTLITRVIVDADDPAFAAPTKFIGPIYDERAAQAAAKRYGWTVKPDGEHWRRVVASPEPRRIVQLPAIEQLTASGLIVICAGGGGVPVVETPDGRQRGVDAVIDKDLTSSMLARDLGAGVLVMATDVDAVYEGFGTPDARPIRRATPTSLRAAAFPAGSMGPKVDAACRFVEATGGRAAIGSLTDLVALLSGDAGTQIRADQARPEVDRGAA